MSDQKIEKQVSKQSQPKKETIVSDEQIARQATLTRIPGKLIGSITEVSIQAQTTHLNDTRFLTAQRQGMAVQIGRIQGTCTYSVS